LTESQATRQQRLNDTEPEHNDLLDPVDPLEEEEAHGRIGYGRFGERTPYILAVAILLTVVVIAGIDWWQNQDDTSGERARIGESAPTIELTTLDGGTFDLEAHRGKVVVVNFWATWCEPCKEEMPALVDLANANPDDVVILGIAATTDKPENIAQFVEQYGITYALAKDTGNDGPVGDTGSTYRVPGYPATFVIDPEGAVTFIQLGPLELDGFQALVDDAKTP
jgi:thiol-disulfide isomerase/thioredoxin